MSRLGARRRVAMLGVGAAVAVVLVTAVPAGAHNGWDPATAAPGSIIDLTLQVADEQAAAGTTRLELRFPQPLTVVALPEVPGWTATPVDGQVGGPANGVVWSGGPAPGDLALPITLGPLPAQPGRLQFKTVQTYDDGTEVAWIDDWPAGAPEPEHPGPVLDLVEGGPGSIPPPTTAAPTTTATTSTTSTTTPTTTDVDETAAREEDDDSDSPVVPLAIAAAVVVAAATAGFVLVRRSRNP